MAESPPRRRHPAMLAAIERIWATRGRARQFWRAFEQSPIPMVTVDGDKRYHAANGPARLLFRLSLEDWRRRRIEDLTPPHMMATLAQVWSRLLNRGAVSGRYDCDLPDGSRMTIVYSALANLLPGVHLIVFMPADWRDDELAELIGDEVAPSPGALSRREREVLTLIAEGANLGEIAGELTISVPTVRTHARNALRKLGARNRAHAIALALRDSVIEGPRLTTGEAESSD